MHKHVHLEDLVKMMRISYVHWGGRKSIIGNIEGRDFAIESVTAILVHAYILLKGPELFFSFGNISVLEVFKEKDCCITFQLHVHVLMMNSIIYLLVAT